jgi:hypothetical protein
MTVSRRPAWSSFDFHGIVKLLQFLFCRVSARRTGFYFAWKLWSMTPKNARRLPDDIMPHLLESIMFMNFGRSDQKSP